jgi:hypothetical protein
LGAHAGRSSPVNSLKQMRKISNIYFSVLLAISNGVMSVKDADDKCL